MGLLEGLYYDEKGEPTELLRNTWRRLEIGEIEAAKIREERAAIRKKKLAERKAKKDAEAAAAKRR